MNLNQLQTLKHLILTTVKPRQKSDGKCLCLDFSITIKRKIKLETTERNPIYVRVQK